MPKIIGKNYAARLANNKPSIHQLDFGDDAWQKLCLNNLINNRELLKATHQVLLPEFWMKETDQRVVKYVLDYNTEHGHGPTMDEVKTKFAGFEWLTATPPMSDVDLNTWKTNIGGHDMFAMNRKTYLFALDLMIDRSNDAFNYNKFMEAVKDIASYKISTRKVVMLMEDPAKFLRDSIENTTFLSTGWPSLDAAVKGFPRGGLIFVTAPSGVGKSLMMCNIAVQQMLRGHNVLYVTLEMSDVDIGRRMLALMNDVANDNLDDENNIVEIDLKIKKLKSTINNGEIVISRMTEGKTTVDEIDDLVRSFEGEIKFDFIIVDYLDLLVAPGYSGGDNLAQRDENLSINLHGLAFEHNAVVVTASQLNREAIPVNEAGNVYAHNHIAGGLGKIRTADLVIGMINNSTTKSTNSIEICIMKCRNRSITNDKISMQYNSRTLAIHDSGSQTLAKIFANGGIVESTYVPPSQPSNNTQAAQNIMNTFKLNAAAKLNK